MLISNILGVLPNLSHMFSTKVSRKKSLVIISCMAKQLLAFVFSLLCQLDLTTLSMHAKSKCNVSNCCSACVMPACVLGIICEQLIIISNYQSIHGSFCHIDLL